MAGAHLPALPHALGHEQTNRPWPAPRSATVAAMSVSVTVTAPALPVLAALLVAVLAWRPRRAPAVAVEHRHALPAHSPAEGGPAVASVASPARAPVQRSTRRSTFQLDAYRPTVGPECVEGWAGVWEPVGTDVTSGSPGPDHHHQNRHPHAPAVLRPCRSEVPAGGARGAILPVHPETGVRSHFGLTSSVTRRVARIRPTSGGTVLVEYVAAQTCERASAGVSAANTDAEALTAHNGRGTGLRVKWKANVWLCATHRQGSRPLVPRRHPQFLPNLRHSVK